MQKKGMKRNQFLAGVLFTMLFIFFLTMTEQTEVWAANYPVIEKGELHANESQQMCIEAHGDKGFYYVAYKFHVSNLKNYYGIQVMKAEDTTHSPRWFVVKDLNDEAVKVAEGAALDNWVELGSALGNDRKLSVNEDYYFCVSSHEAADFNSTVTFTENMDNEGDTPELADVIIPNVPKVGGLEDAADVDVFELDAKDVYQLKIKADKNIDFSIYSDTALSNCVFHDEDNDISSDTTKYFATGGKYYVVIKCSGTDSANPKGEPIVYEMQFVSTGEGSGDITDASYLSVQNNAKYMITNMTSANTYKINGKKLIVKRGKKGVLFQKSKINNGVYTKSKSLRKKSYKFKLAKNYKIIYGNNEDGLDESIKDKNWFNKTYKKSKASTKNNIHLFVNKKNEIVMIYICSWDIGAEQTE